MEAGIDSLSLDENEPANEQHWAIKQSGGYELDPEVPSLFFTPAKLLSTREAVYAAPEGSLLAKAWEYSLQRARQASHADMGDFVPYNGDDVDTFQEVAMKVFNPLLFMATVGAISSDHSLIDKGKYVLLLWARANPFPGICLITSTKRKGGISLAGLMIARFMDRLAESYRILAAAMSGPEKRAMEIWFHSLGDTIKRSHIYWLNNHAKEGPSNHHTWQTFGMMVCGSIAKDQALVDYALKGQDNKWNYVKLVQWAIHNKSRGKNMFREGTNSKGKLYSFGGIAEDGEIYDRYRTLCEDKPPCGLHYALFSLRAFVYCAHFIICNELNIGDNPASSTSPYDLSGHALKNALHLYGQFFIEYPTACCKSHIALEPYRGQQLDEHALAAYLLALEDTPRDRVVSTVIVTNIVLPPPEVSHPRGSDEKRIDYPILKKAHPLNMPLCILVLLQEKELHEAQRLHHTKI